MKKKLIVTIIAVMLIAVMSVALVACDDGAVGNNLIFGNELLKVTAQLDVLNSLKNGSADIGVMDSVMANYYATQGSYVNDIMVLEDLSLTEESYGIAAKKGNNALMSKINEALIALTADGTMLSVANQFGLADDLVISASTTNPITNATDSSWSNVASKNKLIIGYTVFAPIAFTPDNPAPNAPDNGLTGFDIELARECVNYLNTTYSANIDVDFEPIEWNNKENLLETGSIDLVWNGMTITEDRVANMAISVPYLANKQAVVIRKSDSEKYAALRSFFINSKNAIVAVESGSAGQDCMEY